MTTLRVLVGCEFTGTVRRAFAARGHDAWSCDLLPAEDRSNKHITGDIRDILADGWDLLIVAHPPCTRLCRAGRRWLSGEGFMTPPKKLPAGRTWDSMKQEFKDGVDLFTACWRAPVDRIAIENPEMHDIAKAHMPNDLPAPQMVQPHHFGHPEYKNTGWYLKNLPCLTPTHKLPEPQRGSDEWKKWCRVHRMPPGPERAKERSRFFPGMADACADQWGGWALESIAA
ncbi:MAG: hypothetical protein JKY47_00805 [Thalassospira sp.]|jgi:hypothetical protein|uniref:hypothetical protein n=1 Tax=unclassified Thalassospira TaxID=2648997 RepID=UPI000D7749EB|nr:MULTISPECIES: hypothetical protein [unclassified Thalassospira]MBL4839351.1 hypothetical protein [Thalassospira sp.]PXX36235.1 hypothetical protein C7967_101628 [Thalassospira sp. 11-3]QPL37441.1 hypothetical protein IT971_09205 [Thalassospira sp. B30-1]